MVNVTICDIHTDPMAYHLPIGWLILFDGNDL